MRPQTAAAIFATLVFSQTFSAPVMPHMTEQNFDTALARVTDLVADFKKHERDYLAPSYSEQDARKDFIDKFWIALGWNVNHET
jgi:hypothetical protein